MHWSCTTWRAASADWARKTRRCPRCAKRMTPAFATPTGRAAIPTSRLCATIRSSTGCIRRARDLVAHDARRVFDLLFGIEDVRRKTDAVEPELLVRRPDHQPVLVEQHPHECGSFDRVRQDAGEH